jgi:hypothetical protein
VQDASERVGDVAGLQRLHEQLADAGSECSLCQDRAAISTHQYDRQLATPPAQHAREPGPGESGHDIIGDDGVEVRGAASNAASAARLSENDTGS